MVSNPPSRRLGAVLAGGRSSRFGSDKAAAMLDGVPLIGHAAATLLPLCAEVIVVGREWPGMRWVEDRPTVDLGPLGGIAGAFHAARAGGFAEVLTIGCDMPRLSDPVVAALLEGGSRWCIGAPVVGCWQATLGAHLDAWLADGHSRAVRHWARAAGAEPVCEGVAIANVNTPADLARL